MKRILLLITVGSVAFMASCSNSRFLTVIYGNIGLSYKSIHPTK